MNKEEFIRLLDETLDVEYVLKEKDYSSAVYADVYTIKDGVIWGYTNLRYNHDDVFPTFIEWISDSNRDPVPLRPVFGVIGFEPVEGTKQ